MTGELLERGRTAYERRAWHECWTTLREADSACPLEAPDLVMLAVSGYLVGEDESGIDALARAHARYLDVGDYRRATRCGFYLSFLLGATNEPARSNAWAARVRALVEQHQLDGAEPALLDAYAAHVALESGDVAGALDAAERAVRIGRDTGDAELRTLGLLTTAHARIHLGHAAAATACIDEVMLAVSGAELSPPVAGVVYCSVIAACFRSHDVARAREWTAALTNWCDVQTGLVPYRGVCLVHRAELMTLSGNWADAQLEIARAREQARHPAIGEAFYRQGELHRLRGEFADAEAAYRQANAWGRQPEPGLVRLRAAQGRLAAATVTVRRLQTEIKDPGVRPDVLAACVDIAVRVPDIELARAAAAELDDIAVAATSPLLRALAARADGQVALADGRAANGLSALRSSWRAWQNLDMPYEAAVTRVLIGECLAAQGDADAAAMEYDAARWWFEQLGAQPDLDRATALAQPAREASDRPANGLTDRELQVLRLVAAGGTNRAIAGELFLSEKTVARHISNIFTKLGVSSRAAATAYAYDHDLVGRA
ncbi:MAG TPA: response regulator transcription factor [Micromonosporaceae bacterium]|nr:response regulator transcription factor [Micromonosporaceae bacterium]